MFSVDQSLVMKRVVVSAIVLVAVIGVGFVLRSRPAAVELSAATAAMPSLLELHTMAGVQWRNWRINHWCIRRLKNVKVNQLYKSGTSQAVVRADRWFGTAGRRFESSCPDQLSKPIHYLE
jgi:hypothetical protein